MRQLAVDRIAFTTKHRKPSKESRRRGSAVVLILCGGDKRTQAADIKRAIKSVADQKE
jgi:hypothetical protein